MPRIAAVIGAIVAGCFAFEKGAADEFLPPVRLEAAGKAIDTEGGHAAPYVGDFDGDGKQDLLVGQFGTDDGLLSIYRNVGANDRPKFAAAERFTAGGQEGRVPTG